MSDPGRPVPHHGSGGVSVPISAVSSLFGVRINCGEGERGEHAKAEAQAHQDMSMARRKVWLETAAASALPAPADAKDAKEDE